MTKLVYSTEAVPLNDGERYRNPRYFTGPEEGVTGVRVVGDWPGIAASYALIGVPVSGRVVKTPAVEPHDGEFGILAHAFAAEQLDEPEPEPEPVKKARRAR